MTAVRTGEAPAPGRHGPRPLRRLAALGLFVGLPLGAAALGVSGLLSAIDASRRADHAEETARAIVHQLDRRSGAGAKPIDETVLFLGSPSQSLAQAELQTIVTGRVEAARGRVAQVQPLDRTEQDPPGRVAAEIAFDIDNAGLLDLLHAIEAGLPILTVPRLDIHVEPAADAPGAPGDLLRVSMRVEGSWRAAPR